MRLTFDLDSVIFDLRPLCRKAFAMAGEKYVQQTSWDVDSVYSPTVCKNLKQLWSDDILYEMPVLDKKIPYILNGLIANPKYEVFFVTERRLKQPEMTFMQLQKAGINCDFSQVFDQEGKKSDILRDIIKPDVHFDDSPFVVQGCLDKGVPVVMISNNSTLYNHYLRSRVEYYRSLRQALLKKGLYNPKTI